MLFFVLDRDFFPEFFDPNSKGGIWKGGFEDNYPDLIGEILDFKRRAKGQV